MLCPRKTTETESFQRSKGNCWLEGACIPRLIKSAKRAAQEGKKREGRPRSSCVILKINTRTQTHAYALSETNKTGKKKGNKKEKKKKKLGPAGSISSFQFKNFCSFFFFLFFSFFVLLLYFPLYIPSPFVMRAVVTGSVTYAIMTAAGASLLFVWWLGLGSQTLTTFLIFFFLGSFLSVRC